eukprot:gene20156-4860_t
MLMYLVLLSLLIGMAIGVEPFVSSPDVLVVTEAVDAFSSPTLGNGYIGYKVGDHCDTKKCRRHTSLGDAQSTLGGLHIGGVFNGLSNSTPSHRARLPSIHNVYVESASSSFSPSLSTQNSTTTSASAADDGGGTAVRWFTEGRTDTTPGALNVTPRSGVVDGSVTMTEQALDLRQAVFKNRTVVEADSSAGALNGPAAAAAANCTVRLASRAISFADADDFKLGPIAPAQGSPPPGTESLVTVAGTTAQAELQGLRPTAVGLAFESVPDSVTLNLDTTPHIQFLAAARTELDYSRSNPLRADADAEGVDGKLHTPATAMLLDNLTAAAVADLVAAKQLSPAALFAEHAAAWADVWQSGVEISGNSSVAAAVNASLYYIHLAVRADWPHGLSPGGLASNSYDGRSFWDTETWMFPVLDLLDPQLGASLLQYRLDRLPAAVARASQMYGNLSGTGAAQFPWVSTQTGFGCTQVPANQQCANGVGCTGLGWEEQHISGDIAMAFRLHWRSAHDLAFLKRSLPLINGICTFFASRFAPGFGPSGHNVSISSVVGPDEASSVHDDDIYTNAVGSETLKFCVEVASILNNASNNSNASFGSKNDANSSYSAPLLARWADIADRVYLPTSTTLVDSGGLAVHPQNRDYLGGSSDCCESGRGKAGNGCCIEQSAVVLMQYPLGLDQPEEVKLNDIKYYEPRTIANGFFTGDSIYSIAWLALGNASAAVDQWDAAFDHMDPRFHVFREELQGGAREFHYRGRRVLAECDSRMVRCPDSFRQHDTCSTKAAAGGRWRSCAAQYPLPRRAAGCQ